MPLQPGCREDLGGDFLDRAAGGIEPGNVLALVELFHCFHFHPALIERGVATVGAALGPNLLQPLGPDGQAEQLVLVRP